MATTSKVDSTEVSAIERDSLTLPDKPMRHKAGAINIGGISSEPAVAYSETIRLAEDQDYDEIFKLTIDLFRNHDNLGSNTWISLEDFRGLIRENFVHFYALSTSIPEGGLNNIDAGSKPDQRASKQSKNDVGETVGGYVAFMDDYDLQFGGPGIFVDQLFVCKELRGRGHGKHLLNEVYKHALARGAKYIKLFFQERHDRRIFYKRLGFTDYSESLLFLRFFEMFGSNQMKNYLGLDVYEDFRDTQKGATHPNMDLSPFKEAGFEYIIKSLKLTPAGHFKDIYPFPKPRLVIIAKYPSVINKYCEQLIQDQFKHLIEPKWEGNNEDPRVIWTRISDFYREHDSTIQICGFVERPSICCWLGHKLKFCNFVGDLNLITKELIVRRIRSWNPEWGPILGVDMEIAGVENEEPTGENNALIKTLNSLGLDISDRLNCAILDEKLIRANIEKEGE